MKSFRFLILSVVLVAIILVVFLFRIPITHFFRNVGILISGVADPNFSYESYENLKMQKDVLMQSCPVKNDCNSSIRSGRYDYKEASVFSNYPFNNYASIAIGLGSDDGIGVGMPVMAAEGVLLGKIKNVKRTVSEVETIFDPNWRSAVVFGANRSKALLVGGPAPYLDLISKEDISNVGDPVLSTAKDFPMNLLAGKILNQESGDNDAWYRAKMEPPFHFENLEKVLVVLNFP